MREEYTQITIDTIMVNDEAMAKEVSEKAKAGEDFAHCLKPMTQTLPLRKTAAMDR